MIAKEARQALALQRFAEANPQLLEEIRELDAREQAQQIEWAFEDAAIAANWPCNRSRKPRSNCRPCAWRHTARWLKRWGWSGKSTASSTRSILNKGSEVVAAVV